MDSHTEYTDFSDNSIETTLQEIQGLDKSNTERKILNYLRSLDLRMMTDPRRKQKLYNKTSLSIIEKIKDDDSNSQLSTTGAIKSLKEIPTFSSEVFSNSKNPLLLRRRQKQ